MTPLIKTINPANGIPLETYPIMNDQALTDAIESTHRAYLKWKLVDFSTRSKKLNGIAKILDKNKSDYARLMALEMGKPISAGEKEVEKCAWICRYYAEHAEQLLKPVLTQFNKAKNIVCYQPQGLIFAIMPWNFPMWQVFRFIVPNLMAGQGCLLKHASNVTGTALAIEKIIEEADLQKNIFRTLLINHQQSEKIIAHPKITGVTLTGSITAGREIASQAGHALKKSVLELGGSDPYLILADANLEQAADTCMFSRLNNSGQVCIAAKRIIVIASIYHDFKKIILQKIKKFKLGDPLKKGDHLGPLARENLRDHVHQQVQNCIKAGALLEWGGEIPPGNGFYYPPTLLSNVTSGSPAYEEEIFGPVVALLSAENEAHAIKIANDTAFGLGAAVFTKDIKRGEAIATQALEAGVCAINTLVRSDPRLPFGGIKNSGYGRELATEGIRAFMNVKTILTEPI